MITFLVPPILQVLKINNQTLKATTPINETALVKFQSPPPLNVSSVPAGAAINSSAPLELCATSCHPHVLGSWRHKRLYRCCMACPTCLLQWLSLMSCPIEQVAGGSCSF